MEEKQPLTVKALTKYIKLKFDYDKNLQHLVLKGEISNFKRHSRGHFYFTLKDDEAQISAVMFASAASLVKFMPKEGMQVVVKGHITVYEAGGSYSLYVKEMTEDGVGNLYVAFTQMKERLGAEGLFDPKYKKPIPSYPNAIGIITSPTGAAIRDILSTIKRRYPLVKIYLYPALVQGEQAAPSIVKCIEQANQMGLVDTLIVGRGGGSIEDLWAFNEESVARAIFQSKIPIISAVGHETDFTIADFVADHRAPTPTGAAEVAVPNLPDVLRHFSQLNVRLNHNTNVHLQQAKQRLDQLRQHYILKNPHSLFEQRMMYVSQLGDRLQHTLQQQMSQRQHQLMTYNQQLQQFNPRQRVVNYQQRVEFLTKELQLGINKQLSIHQQQLGMYVTKLEILNPMSILKKGYSVITNEQEEMVTSVKQLVTGQKVSIALDDGAFLASVEDIESNQSKMIKG